MFKSVFWICFCLPLCLKAQKLNKYWLELRDKAQSPYCTCRPGDFLSLRSIERRVNAGIPIEENDLPPSPVYLHTIRDAGLQIHGVSKWLNAVVIIADSAAAVKAARLPFVKRVQYLGPHLKFRNPPNRIPKSRVPLSNYPKPGGADNPMGYASLQNSLLGLHPIHAAGHRGRNIWIAVMDGGFTNTDTIPLFDSIALQGRLIPGWDFVERDAGLFEAAQHGTSVLSVMAANLPGYFVGTAPDATYFLLKTEDTGGEFPIEEANWVSAAEWADSVGVDIINASLGYTQFNDPTLGHTYAELNGKASIGARGAAIAAEKGMIVCNSAGNEGDGAWRYIGVPADAQGVIAVGAIDNDGQRADFSSVGPTADGRIKPDLMAPGETVVVAGYSGIDLGLSSGTSLASPMLAGGLAALWSATPEKTAREILEAVFNNADQNEQPDNERGYGLPDLTSAWLDLGNFLQGEFPYTYHPVRQTLSLLGLPADDAPNVRVELFDIHGRALEIEKIHWNRSAISTLSLTLPKRLSGGSYRLRLLRRDDPILLNLAIFP